ncbi:MAG: DUF2752 domain-containing protein [Lachnospiraceae bacterium]|nr:DUF2752 domain-containing protein [Lachnospiraceae bacterium]
MNESINDVLYRIGKWVIVLAIPAVFFIWMYGDSWMVYVPDCYFESVTGWYCPGCGASRALTALVQGKVFKSILYHPSVLYGMIVYLIFMIRMFFGKHFKPGSMKDGFILPYIYIGIALTLIQWVIKLVLLIKYDIPVL